MFVSTIVLFHFFIRNERLIKCGYLLNIVT